MISGKWIALSLGVVAAFAAAQDHPAFTPPAGFSVARSGEREREFAQVVPNGDRLRLRVALRPDGGDAESISRSAAAEDGDEIRSETRQELAAGALRGVGYSVVGKSETVDGVSYTRYRRVMGLAIEGSPPPFAVRADILAKEPKPAQSTLEAMGRALTDWQQSLGGAKSDSGSGADAAKPQLGGEKTVRLTGGGDLEIEVPSFWGRADLRHGPGHEEIVLGPAREVLEKVTLESIAKDKDRIGPYISITRIQKDTFADLVDVQLLDIQESLLADYVARMAEGGVTLELSEDRDEGTLGSRTVISVPFEETRASGTRHWGRSVFMMHRGSLVIVTASHPVEKFDEGWPDVAKAFDTLLFTGASEAETPIEGPPSRPEEGREPESGEPAAPPREPATEPPAEPAPSAPSEWITPAGGGLASVRIPLPTPVGFSMPASWTLIGDVDPERRFDAFFAVPDAAADIAALGTWLRIDTVAFLEELAGEDGLERLGALMRLRLEHEARASGLRLEVFSVQPAVALAERTGVAIQYGLEGAGGATANGTFTGTTFDGTAMLFDLRVAAADAAGLTPVAGRMLTSIRILADAPMERRSFGRYSLLVPDDWEVSDEENQGGGRNVFLRAPSGVDLRFQTAIQKNHDVVDTEVLRRVSTGFLVEGLKVLSLRDMAGAARFPAPGGEPGLRFAASTPQVDVLVLAYMQAEHLVFALRGVPPGYEGRDLAVAWRIVRSFVVEGAGRSPPDDPLRLAGAAVTRPVVFSRTELDAVAPDGTSGQPSRLSVRLERDGGAVVTVDRRGKLEEVRGTYRIEDGVLTIEGPGLGRMVYRFSEDGETLTGDSPGDVLFRTRSEEPA